jgi:hypothetical protein
LARGFTVIFERFMIDIVDRPGYLLTEYLVIRYWLIYCDEHGWFQRTAPNFVGISKKRDVQRTVLDK